MVAVAHLIAEFSRVALDVHFATELPFHAPKCGKQVSRRNVPHGEKVDVALGPFFAPSDRPVDSSPIYLVAKPH